ncbi:hypothetical protein AA313_de0208015 [Arthrobotrys entomopaga]|nr:hypothetical protein AA313_de0208015 [Arthrobotrys entomopaga]
MESSPVPAATQNDEEDIVKVTSVIMVAEEQLEEVKESLQEVLSIHVYSIEPAPFKDLLGAAEASLDLYSRFPCTDSVERSKLYGSTLNKYVKRREGAAPPPPPQSTKSSAYVVPVKKEPAPTPSAPPAASKERKEAKDFFSNMKAKETPKQTQQSGPSSSAKAKIPLKRGQSDLMSSFSNAQPKKAKQPEKEKTPPPDFMDVDDDEPEDEPVDEEAKAAEAAKQEEIRKKRAKDEEALRRMMDDDDDEDDEPTPTKPTQDSASPEPTAASPTEEEPVPATTSTSAPGRRKAKRKVTKKVRSKDENGYIVTREVVEWEEYSEDDVPAPVKPAAKPNAFSAMKQAPSSQKGKKATGGDGAPKRDIASFFQRK